MEMPEGWKVLDKFDEYNWTYRLGTALNLMKEMAEELQEQQNRVWNQQPYGVPENLRWTSPSLDKFKSWK